MSKDRRFRFTVVCVKWVDKVNGNTYHSVRCIRHRNGAVVVGSYRYGYGDHYQQTALEVMAKAKWLPKKYRDNLHVYEQENNYPILWSCTEGLKRDCIANGQL